MYDDERSGDEAILDPGAVTSKIQIIPKRCVAPGE
jgi:hypothetical protein